MRDEFFLRKEKVPMTKEEARSLSLSYLQLHDARCLLDIGAGSGSVILEALLLFPHLYGTAIEMKEEAVQLILENAHHMSLKDSTLPGRLQVLEGTAPMELSHLWDRIFVGGTAGNVQEIIHWCSHHLEANGILVMNFITLENFFQALEELEKSPEFTDLRGGQMAFSRLDLLAKYHVLKSTNPIFILACKKVEKSS